MSFKTKPYPHQEHAVTMIEDSDNVGLLWEMGCISGDSTVKINRGGCSRQYTLREVFHKFTKSWRRDVPTRIRSVKDGRIGLNNVVNILSSGVKTTLELKLENGFKVRATRDHEILTDRGFIPLEKLVVGKDQVCCDTLTRWKRKDSRKLIKKPRYNLRQVGEFYPYGHYTTSKGKKIKRSEVHRLVAEANLNGIDLDTFILKTRSPNDLKFIDPSKYHVHHKDHDTKNNLISNLEVMEACKHLERHGDYSNFGHGKPEFFHIASIGGKKEEDTYDIVCEDPYRNFITNGIVVHNCGKTKGIIDILRVLYARKGKLRKTLIVSPLVTLFNWKNEFKVHSFINQDDIVVLSKSGTMNKLKQFNKALTDTDNLLTLDKIVIVNYEALRGEALEDAVDLWGPEIIVADESHYIKNPKAKITKKMVKLGDNANHKFILTGTPILNSVQDIFSQFRFLDGGKTFGKNYRMFETRYLRDANEAWAHSQKHFRKLVAREDTFDELNAKVYTICHRVTTEEVMKHLPPLIKTQRHVNLSNEQLRIYKELEKDFISFIDTKKGEPEAVVAQLAITKAMRLMQLCTGFTVTESGEVVDLGNVPRLQLTKELLQEIVVENKNQCILWCSFRYNYIQLERICKELEIPHVFITGDMNLDAKNKAMEDFAKGDARVVIANRRAGGIGVNLTTAKYSIVYSRNFSLGEELQSEKRNHRGGSEMHDKVIKIDLVTPGTIEEVCVDALMSKDNMSKRVIDYARSQK